MGKAGKFVGKAENSWARRKIALPTPALPTNFPPCPRIFRLAHEFSALPTNIPSCPRIFRLAHEFSALPTNFPPCPRIFRRLAHEFPGLAHEFSTLPTKFLPSQGLRGQGLGSRVGWGYARQMGWVCGGGGRAESRWLFLAHFWP